MTQSLTPLHDQSPPARPPQAQRNVELKLFFYLSAFSSVCNEYFSQTQSLPKLNTLDLSLVTYCFGICTKTNSQNKHQKLLWHTFLIRF